MPGALRMSREEMAAGFAAGRSLIQEEWANSQEIAWVDELIAEGKATATAWEYHPNYQCERRRVTAAAPSAIEVDGSTLGTGREAMKITDEMVNAADSVLSRRRPGIPDETIRMATGKEITSNPLQTSASSVRIAPEEISAPNVARGASDD